MTDYYPRDGVVAERWPDGTARVVDDQGNEHWLRGINATPAPVGTRGSLEYRRTDSTGLWYFTPYPKGVGE